MKAFSYRGSSSDAEFARVDCGKCRLCCQRNMLVILIDGDDDPGRFKCHMHPTMVGTTYVLDHKANGDCAHLGPNGCEIHGKHPVMCRVFDCVDLVRKIRPKIDSVIPHVLLDSVVAEGLRRLHAMKESDNS